MKKRIFIGINIPAKEKQLISKAIKKWEDLPVRWTKTDSLHVTVLFIGSVYDEEAVEIIDNVRQAAREIGSFDLDFDRVKSLGDHAAQPQKNLENNATSKREVPKMIWAFGEKSEELAKLKNAIERQLADIGTHRIEHAKNPITPHITLGRIYGSRWKKLENPPEIDEKINFSVPVESIEIMESNMLKDGVEYIVLESIKL